MLKPHCLLIALGMVWMASLTNAGETVSFDRDVRSILAANCFACHGADKQKGNLRLDRHEVATVAAKSGEIPIVPGKPEASELIRRVTAPDKDDSHMPPADDGKKLTTAQIDVLKRWIADGAPYTVHWAFAAPVRPNLPSVKNQAWCRNAIDAFVLAKLEAEGMYPADESDKITLLRRLHLDLIGLPPTPAEVDAFLADRSPDAYEKQVERLLASPHYGERWGRHWLDVARYADSDGFEKDKLRTVWHYRDYVINAFNKDLPYDRFIIEQLAGDQLPLATQDQIVATGFLRNSMLNQEAGVDPEQFRMDAMFDRMDAIGKGILGLTIQCAQCHAHKSDPITQLDYYRMLAFLNNDNESQRIVYTPDELAKIAALTQKIREIETGLRRDTPDWEEKLNAWEDSASQNQPHWIVIPLENAGDNAQRYLPQPDGSYLAQGYAPANVTASFRWTSQLPPITAFRLELLTDPNLPCGGPGRSSTGVCALTEFSVDAAPAENPGAKTAVKLATATSDCDLAQTEIGHEFDDQSGKRRIVGPAKFAIDGDDSTAWGIDAGPGRRNQPRNAVFTCATPVVAAKQSPPRAPATILTFNLKQSHGGPDAVDLVNNNLGRFRISVTIDRGPIVADPLPKRVREILAIRRARRTEFQRAAVFSYWRTTQPQWKAANDRIEALWKQWPEGSTALTFTPRDEPRDTRVLTRGDWLLPTNDRAAPGVPSFLNPLPSDQTPTRLAFANWLVDRKSPTTARAFVNRVWQAYFGGGIVATPEDLGTQGAPPSHPELLDWLACEFMEKGWSMKQLHRLIVTSATYRQSSHMSAEALEKDPDNRLLARGSRLRVDGEIVRDIALSASGLLNAKIGGRSVMPPAPAFLFRPPSSFAPFPWVDETGDEKYRRAIYTFRRRTTPYPMLQAFDVPNADSSCVRRMRSNSPLQALTSLNEPIFVDCARTLARKAIEEGGATDADRITYAFRQMLARKPGEAELAKLTLLLQKEQSRFNQNAASADEVIRGDQSKSDPPSNISPAQWAAYTVVTRVLLNLDETITRE
jgi:hypothetical protein